MDNSFKALLLVVLADMVHGRPVAQSFLEDNPMEFIGEALDFYNGESHSDVVFALYKDEYEYKVGPKGQKQVNFTIKETVCLKLENRTIGNCEFKLDGLEKNCIASKNNQENRFSVICTISSETKKDPGSGFVEKPGSPESDYTDQPEDDASYEDHVIIMDDNEKIFLEEEKRIIDEFLARKTENSQNNPDPARRRTQPGQFLGRFLCFECFFDILPRK